MALTSVKHFIKKKVIKNAKQISDMFLYLAIALSKIDRDMWLHMYITVNMSWHTGNL